VSDISVIVPTRDRTSLLTRCLASIDNQTFRPCEIIVVDDGSAASRRPVVPETLLDIAKVIRLPTPTNAANARNVGLDHAQTSLVAFLDSDDYWASNHLGGALLELARQRADFLFGDFTAISEAGSSWPAQTPAPKLPVDSADYLTKTKGVIRTSTFFGHTRFFRSVRFDSHLEKHQDWDLALRASQRGAVGFNKRATVYIDHEPSCRMSASANPSASQYFLEKHRPNLTQNQWRRLFRRIIKGTALASDKKACQDLLATFRPHLRINDAAYVRLCTVASDNPTPVRALRRAWRWRHLLKQKSLR